MELEGLYKVKKEDIPKCADLAAKSLIDDACSKYILKKKLTLESLGRYFNALFKVLFKSSQMYATSDKIEGLIIFSIGEPAMPSKWDCIFDGLLLECLKLGFGVFTRTVLFEANCDKIRKRLNVKNTAYLFLVNVRPEYQGKKYASKLLRALNEYLDANEKECYLETHREVNTKIYEHFGYKLLSVDKIPDKSFDQFEMIRPKKIKNNEISNEPLKESLNETLIETSNDI